MTWRSPDGHLPVGATVGHVMRTVTVLSFKQLEGAEAREGNSTCGKFHCIDVPLTFLNSLLFMTFHVPPSFLLLKMWIRYYLWLRDALFLRQSVPP